MCKYSDICLMCFMYHVHMNWQPRLYKLTECHHLKKNGSHSLIYNGTIRKLDLVGVGVTLLKKVRHCGSRLRGLRCSSHIPFDLLFLLMVSPDVAFLASFLDQVCLYAIFSHHGDTGLKLWNYKHFPVKYFSFKKIHHYSVSSQQ